MKITLKQMKQSVLPRMCVKMPDMARVTVANNSDMLFALNCCVYDYLRAVGREYVKYVCDTYDNSDEAEFTMRDLGLRGVADFLRNKSDNRVDADALEADLNLCDAVFDGIDATDEMLGKPRSSGTYTFQFMTEIEPDAFNLTTDQINLMKHTRELLAFNLCESAQAHNLTYDDVTDFVESISNIKFEKDDVEVAQTL